jgi:ABC-type amino acid transport substrate-binding protein
LTVAVGITAEAGQAFEAWLNARYAKGHLMIRVVFLPEARESLLPDLIAGKGDVAAGALTITHERLAAVDFAPTWVDGVKEIVLAGSNASKLTSLEGLSGREAYVRASSPCYASLERLNQTFAAKGLAPAQIRAVDEVSAGVLPYTIVCMPTGLWPAHEFRRHRHAPLCETVQ